MTLNAHELVASLPVDLDDSTPSSQQLLTELLSGLEHKPMPIGRLSRLWTVGSMQAKIAMAYLAYWIRSGYASADKKQRLKNEVHLKAALELVASMSYMRGILMKIGQVLSSFPLIVPDEFVEVLGKLQFEAPPMHYALIREHVRNELGKDPEEIFDEFETKAMAAASLGQVHRARLKSGEMVAVKIQYPNIARTIETDFKNFMALMTPMRLNKDWDNLRAQWEDVRQMLTWETDYEREADFLRRGRAVFNEDEQIVIPRVYDEFSTKRVLTMEYIEGMHLDAYLATHPSREECDHFGELLMRGSFRLAHTARIWYADSQPGNYFFMKDGRLGIVDFGCCREFSDEEWDYYVEVGKGYKKGGEAYRRAIMRAVDLDPDGPIEEDHLRLMLELANWFDEYFMYEGTFDFGDAKVIQRGIDLLSEATKKRYFRSKPVNTWINRHLLGLRAILYKLRARVDVKTIGEEELDGLFD